ncbi:hypothetical protein [Nonomuraea insulae]|uniref:Secreted protein n=1 Tax=Nonomuraea insulae TaxID=1616787 RepID=A0ABW1D0S7_9ACTN
MDFWVVVVRGTTGAVVQRELVGVSEVLRLAAVVLCGFGLGSGSGAFRRGWRLRGFGAFRSGRFRGLRGFGAESSLAVVSGQKGRSRVGEWPRS